jgi:hypothetical protein
MPLSTSTIGENSLRSTRMGPSRRSTEVFGVLDGQRFRHHLSQHHVQVGQDADRQDGGDGVRQRPGQRGDPAERALQPGRDGVLAVHAQAQAGQGDAELGGGQVEILLSRTGQNVQDMARCARAALGRLGERVRGAATMANSAATKSPLSRISPVMIKMGTRYWLTWPFPRAYAPPGREWSAG